jgi:hypothetical protein
LHRFFPKITRHKSRHYFFLRETIPVHQIALGGERGARPIAKLGDAALPIIYYLVTFA